MTERSKYFYAHQDVDLYDSTIGLTVPQYELIHQVLAEVVTAHFGVAALEYLRPLICDLGAGTGKESQALLDHLPNSSLVAVDISAPMRVAFESRIRARYGTLDRVAFVVKDMLNDDLLPLLVEQANSRGRSRYDMVVSAYSIHHFSIEDKRKVYKLMYDLLSPGGLMVNIDLLSYNSAKVSREAHDFDMDYIKRSFDDPPDSVLNAPGITKDRLEKLGKDWLLHMVRDNVLHSSEVQLDLLREIGFANCECVFRYWQQGLLRAEKPD